MADEVEMTPITTNEGGTVPPKVTPFGTAASSGVSTIKLKPVIRKPMIRKPTIGGAKPSISPISPAPTPAAAAPAGGAEPATLSAPTPIAPLKKATQNLKSVTGPIPAQAILQKTGIIAEGIITPQQQQASKSKTSRISLESAIGVAPAKEGPAPLKTIRLRRPTDLKPASGAAPAAVPPPAATPVASVKSKTAPIAPAAVAPAPVADAAPAPVAPAPAPAEQPAAAASDANVTQKKTLKIQRPGGIGIKRPTLGVPKPKISGAPAAESAEPEVKSADMEIKDIADLGDVPELTPVSAVGVPAAASADDAGGVPKWLIAISVAASVAALLMASLLAYNLVEEGRYSTGAGANEMAFLDF